MIWMQFNGFKVVTVNNQSDQKLSAALTAQDRAARQQQDAESARQRADLDKFLREARVPRANIRHETIQNNNQSTRGPSPPSPAQPRAPPPAAQLGSSWGKETNPALRNFSRWGDRYVKASPEEQVQMQPEGLNLAQLRREEMARLISMDPAQAIASAVPRNVSVGLTREIRALLGNPISGIGDLDVYGVTPGPDTRNLYSSFIRRASVNGKSYQATLQGPLASVGSQTGVRFEGIEINGQAALTGTPGKSHGANTTPPIVLASDPIDRAYHSLGNDKKMLVVQVDFPDLVGAEINRADLEGRLNVVNNYYRNISQGLFAFEKITVAPQVLRLPQTAKYYAQDNYDELWEHAMAAAKELGADYDSDQYEFAGVSFKEVYSDWAGLANLGAKKFWLDGYWGADPRVIAHEIGHNLGLLHAAAWDPASGSQADDPDGQHVEYGNLYDVMGGGSGTDRFKYPLNWTPFSIHFKQLLGWIPEQNIQTVTDTWSGRIYGADHSLQPNRKYGIRVEANRGLSGKYNLDYWIEHRTRIPGNHYAANGALIYLSDPEGTGVQDSSTCRLLDMDPLTPSMTDAPLQKGYSFTDTDRRWKITVDGQAGSGADSYLDITVNRLEEAPPPSNNPNNTNNPTTNGGTLKSTDPPVITSHPADLNASTGSSITLSSAASGSGLSYQWQRNGVNIEGATGATYTIPNVHDDKSAMGSAGSAKFLKGRLDGMRVYDRDLNATEIAQLAGKSPPIAMQGYSPGQKVWEFATGGIVISSPAIGTDGMIYFGSYDDKVYALNPDGTKKWEFAAGGDVKSSPAIGADGTVYVGSWNNKVYAINPDGSKKWEYATSGIVESSPTIGPDGTIYIGSTDQKLYALNPWGTKKWEFATTDKVSAPPIVGTDGTIYFGGEDNKVYALNSNGSKKWEFVTGAGIHGVQSSLAIGPDGTVYATSHNDGKVFAIESNGTKKWEYTTGGNIFSSPAIGTDGTIYIGSYDNKLYALNPNGTKKWEYLTGDDIISSPAIGTDGIIYFGSYDDKIYGLNPDGTKSWECATGGDIFSSPAIASDGTLYIGSMDQKLYAIATDSMGLANSPWPKFGRNNQRSDLSGRQGLIAHFPFDGNGADTSGNDNNATVGAGATLVPDRFGNPNSAYRTSGASNGRLTWGNTAADSMFGGRTTLSLTTWIKPLAVENSTKVFLEYSGSTFSLEGRTDAGQQVKFYSNNGNAITSTLDVGKWNHVALILDGTKKKFYKNGVLVAETAFSAALNDASSFNIGGRDGSTHTNSDFDDLRIFNRALSADEIADMAGFGGLMAYYPFNGNANDESGNGHHGTATNGAALTSDRLGITNRAYDLDGSNDYILANKLPDSQSLTFSGWFKHDTIGPSNHHLMWDGDASGGKDLTIKITATGAVRFDSKDNDSLETSAVVTANNWYHLVCIADAQANIKAIYIDGQLIKENTNWTGTVNVGNHSDLALGIARDGGPILAQPLKGLFDDIRIYNRALSATEIATLHGSTLSNGLVAHYPFNGNANDESPNHDNNGTVRGADLVPDAQGATDRAYEFDGSDDDILIGDKGFPMGNSARTISGWAKLDTDASGDNTLLFYGQKADGKGFWLGIDGAGDLEASGYGDANASKDFDAEATVNDGKWHHVAFTSDGNQTAHLYVDGALASTKTGFNIDTQAPTAGDYHVVVTNAYGTVNSNAATVTVVPGTLAGFNNGLVAYYPFDGDADDESGNDNDGTVYGATLTTDRFGAASKSYSFDGSNDYVKTPNLWDVGTGEISVSVWFKTDGAITTWMYLTSNKDDFDDNFFRTGFNQTGNLRSYAEEDGDSKAKFITDNEYDDSNWHHAVFTRKGSSAAIYVDGGLLETKSGTTKSGDLGTNDFWFIGQNGLNADWFRGNLDDIRLYNRALSAAEVAQLHSLEKPPVITAQPQSQVVATGSNVTLTADANGTGLNYQWYRNGAAITGATGATYTITGAHNDDATL
ncbi:MAG: PQQ-binding-like beta-propeller repeat protein, partial [Verrucomicrobiota bacterium]|nr:PQQ-binding-like beta-propeller repeat protein [Verrucomicrobiota bacterium]